MKIKIVLIVLTVAYFISRLWNLTLIPIFTDEAIYLRWSQIMSQDWRYLYLPLSDGKPPLFMWLTAIFMYFLPAEDPLLLGRLVSVLAGYLGLGGVIFAALQIFKNSRLSLLCGLLYLISPFAYFYDRFALADSMLSMLMTWGVGLSFMLARKTSVWVSLALGIVAGLGLMTKTPAVFLILYWLVFLIFISAKSGRKRFVQSAGLFLVSGIIAWGLFSTLYLLPESHLIGAKNDQFIIPLSHFLQNPLQLFPGNWPALLSWEIAYLTWPVTALVVLAFLTADRIKSALLLFFLLFHLGTMAAFNKVIYPRFLLTFTPLLLIAAGVGLDFLVVRVSQKIVVFLFAGTVLVPGLFTLYKLQTDPPSAPIASTDANQYLNSWPAGYGVIELREFFRQESLKHSKIVVSTEGTFGLMPYSLELYQKDYPNLEIRSYWPPTDKIADDLLASARAYPSYLLIYQRNPNLNPDQVELVREYRQGYGSDYLRLYRILPK